MSTFRIIRLPKVSDGRGALTILQDSLPFSISRVFWITGADDQIRGGHRHKATRQALVALSGRVTVKMVDPAHEAEIVLEDPADCLVVEPEDWHTMAFGPGSILLVLASLPYDPADYITEGYSR